MRIINGLETEVMKYHDVRYTAKAVRAAVGWR